MMKKLISICVIALLSIALNAEAKEDGIVRLGVMKFSSRTKGVTEQQATAIGDIFARTLANSKSLIIVERDRIEDIANEHKLAQSGSFEDDEVLELGKLISCKYMLLGAVTQLERKTSATDIWILSETHQEVLATIDVRIVDVETSKVIMSLSESGSANRKGEGFNFYGLRTDKGKNFEGIEESAIAEAVFRASFRIREALAGDRIEVVNITAKEITLNAGENWGIGEGTLFGVYSEGEEVKNLDGSSMGRKLTLLAILRITDAQKEFSYAQVMKNGGKASNLRKGNKVEPMTKKEANNLIKQKVFQGKKVARKADLGAMLYTWPEHREEKIT